MMTTVYEYADRRVELHFLRCDLEGDPVGLLGQEIQWVSRSDLARLKFPPADAETAQARKASKTASSLVMVLLSVWPTKLSAFGALPRLKSANRVCRGDVLIAGEHIETSEATYSQAPVHESRLLQIV